MTPGSWLIQAKFLLDNNGAGPSSTANSCGLVSSTNVLIDTVRVPSLGTTGTVGEAEVVTLLGVLTTGLSPTVSVRCNAQAGENFGAEGLKITALQVQSTAGP